MLIRLFLLGHLSNDTDSDSSSTSALGHLTSDLKEPMMSETSVLSDLLHAFNVFSDLGFKQVRRGVEVVSISIVISSVDEPLRDSEGDRIGDDLLDLLPGLLTDLTGSRVEVDLGYLADEVGESRSDSSDRGYRVGDFALSLKVGVQDSDDVFELSCVLVDETLTLFI